MRKAGIPDSTSSLVMEPQKLPGQDEERDY